MDVWEDKDIRLCIDRHRETLSQNKANIDKRQMFSWKIQHVRSEDIRGNWKKEDTIKLIG